MNYTNLNREKLIEEITILKNEISCLINKKNELSINLETMKKLKKKYETLVENINEVIFVLKNTSITYISPRIQDVFGYSQEEVIGKDYRTFLHPDDKNILKLNLNDIFEEKQINFECRIIHKNNGIKHVKTNPRLIRQDEKTVEITGVLTDNTDRKNSDILLQESEEKLQILADNIADVLWVLDINLNFIYVSPAVENVRGFSVKEIMSMKLKDYLTPSSFNDIIKSYNEEMEKEKSNNSIKTRSRTIELEIRLKDGSTAITETIVSFLRDPAGNAVGILGINRDITSRKKIEKKINESLMEKEILLREIHHRVKNNFQIITSLLNLQENKIKDKKLLQIFKDSQNRIRAMALIHERLYQSKNLASINLAEYINLITHELCETYECNSDRIQLNVHAESVILGINQAIPCGLIINEILTNSIKYAFPEYYKGKGEITIRLSADKETEIISLSISDNGIGLPENVDINNSETLGIQLISMLSQNQLKGQLMVDRNNGTKFILEFMK